MTLAKKNDFSSDLWIFGHQKQPSKKKKTIGKNQVREKISMIQLSNQLHWIEIIWVNIFDIGANDMLNVRGVFNIRTSSICVITR